jgi:hypothetical protein
MCVEGNRVVRADGDHNTLNHGEFLDKTIAGLIIKSSDSLNNYQVVKILTAAEHPPVT